MPNNTILTPDDIRTEVMLALGGSGVDVELAEEDVHYCIRETLRRYNRARPGHGHFALQATKSQRRYEIIKPGIQGIVRVEFVERPNLEGDLFDPFFFNAYGLTPLGETFAEYSLRRKAIEQGRRVLGVEPEWNAEKEDGKVALYVKISIPYFVWVTYSWHYEPDNNPETGMQWIPDSDTDVFMDFCIAYAKRIVAMKRGKFEGVLSPDGATNPIDASTLREEAKMELEQAQEKLNNRRRPMLPEIE